VCVCVCVCVRERERERERESARANLSESLGAIKGLTDVARLWSSEPRN